MVATVVPTVTDVTGDGQVKKFVWALTTADHTGHPIGPAHAEFADRTIYFLGAATWGSATAIWEGGGNVAAYAGADAAGAATYLPLADPQGGAISKTADGIEVLLDIPEFSRPRLSAVGVAAVVTAVCIARRGFRRSA